jgi:hypothetical protein
MSDGEKASFLYKEIDSLYKKLQTETDATKIADLVRQIQTDIGLVGGIDSGTGINKLGGASQLQNDPAFIKWATDLLNSVNAFAQGAISNAGADVAALNDKYGLGPFFEGLKKDFADFTNSVSNLGDDVSDPEAEPRRGIGRLGRGASDAADQADRMAQSGNRAAASMEGMANWIDHITGKFAALGGVIPDGSGGGGSGALDTLRRNPYAASRRTGG